VSVRRAAAVAALVALGAPAGAGAAARAPRVDSSPARAGTVR